MSGRGRGTGIFEPRVRFTAGLERKLAAISARLDRLEPADALGRRELAIRREITPVRTTATTRIEGYGDPGGPYRDEDVAAANRGAELAYDFIDYLAAVPEVPIDELAMREMNRLFLTGASPAVTPGAYRRGQNRVGNFTPPDQGDVPGLMRGLSGWLATSDLPVLATAAIAHLEFVAIHPFWDGNGRTARGLSAVVIQRSWPYGGALLAFEPELYARRAAYFDAIERSLGRAYRPAYDATPFVRLFTEAVESALDVAEIRMLDARERTRKVSLLSGPDGLSERQAFVLSTLVAEKRLTRRDYIALTGVAPITATRDLNGLVERGLLRVHGRTRTRYYTLP